MNAEPRRECAIMRRRRSLAEWGAVVSLSGVCLVSVAQAQPSADEVLVNAGLTAADKQSVLGGRFVNVSVGAVSERDLSFAIVFLVKKSPEELAKKMIAGELITSDAQVKAFGKLSATGSLENFAKLTMPPRAWCQSKFSFGAW